jgi:HSP20 family molecular chaperone IbpA
MYSQRIYTGNDNMDKKYDDMTEEERKVYDKQERDREAAEQAALPYRWSQDLANVTVSVDLPKGTRGKDLNVVMDKRKLKVGAE